MKRAHSLIRGRTEETRGGETTTSLPKDMDRRARITPLRLQSAVFMHSCSQQLVSEAVPREEQSRFKFHQVSWRNTKTPALFGNACLGAALPLKSYLSLMDCYSSPHSCLISAPLH